MSALRSTLRHHRLLSTATISSPLAASPRNPNPSPPAPDAPLETTTTTTTTDIDTKLFFTTIINFISTRRLNDLKNYMECRKRDPKITQETYFSSLIRAYGMAGKHKEAINLFNEAEKIGAPVSNLSFNALLSACQMCKQHEHVHQLFDEIPNRHNLSPDKTSYNTLITSLCHLGSTKIAMSKLNEMEEKNIEITTPSYVPILEAFYKKDKPDKATNLWDYMVEKGNSPDVVAYNVRLGYAEMKHEPGDVIAVMEEMKSFGLKPDTTSYNYLFLSYSKRGMVEEARGVLKELEENGCLPNGATFRMHMHHLCNCKDYVMAYEVFKESLKMDRVPPFRVLKMVVEGLAKTSRKKEAREMIQKIKEKYPNDRSKSWDKIEGELKLKAESLICQPNSGIFIGHNS